MPTGYYDHTTYPQTNSDGSSSALRAELELIEAGFAKLPDPATHATQLVFVNAGGTALDGNTNLTWTTSSNTLTVNGTIAGTGLTLTSPILSTPVVNTPTINNGAITGASFSAGTIAGTAITGGTVGSLTTALAIADGGTGATSANAARTALGVPAASNGTLTNPSITTPAITNPTITGGGSWASPTLTSPTLTSPTVTSGLTISSGNLSIGGANWTSQIIKASTTWQPNIAAGDTGSVNVTVTGAAEGDFVDVSFGSGHEVADANIIMRGFVRATNSVRVVAYNGAISTWNPASAFTLYVEVRKRVA